MSSFLCLFFFLVVYSSRIRRVDSPSVSSWVASVSYRYEHSNALLTVPLACGCFFLAKRES